ncbi:hypothetical protein P691DRAFT_767253 [Macrolepiota fuliginosa MF-IS2]|uniref:Uncharacterized protein n=1 Tax=Macrolepiota fuliginosa MF-IS2 TaxID=1400762 RepID=A0A9P6BWI8_9AGAR|nr:hypothetical protein P691DRAFT_767253 [Macrolepiota fuliginosa MF-IS2]
MIAYKKVGRAGQAELLPGGRWMLSVHGNGSGCVTDLDQDQPQPQVLFTTFHAGEDPLRDSCTWIDRERPLSSFHVAVFDRAMTANKKGRICIFRISALKKDSGTTFVAKRLSVIRDGPCQAWRTSAALSEEYFIQQIKPDGERMSRLQLRRYSAHAHAGTTAVVERPVALTSPVHLFFLPGNRVGSITRNAVDIFSFKEFKADDGSAMLDLALIHHISSPQNPYRMSPPFVRSSHTYLVSVHDTLRRIIVDHDMAVPPTFEETGKVAYDRGDPSRKAWFGPSACVLI